MAKHPTEFCVCDTEVFHAQGIVHNPLGPTLYVPEEALDISPDHPLVLTCGQIIWWQYTEHYGLRSTITPRISLSI